MPRLPLVGLLVLGLFFGCARPLDRIDNQAARLIEQEIDLTLGLDAPRDPQPVTDRLPEGKPDPAVYNVQPSTRNPAAKALPVDPATDDPEELLRRIERDGSDDVDPDARIMTLEDILRYAIANARDYRTRKEDLFITALNLMRERHLWGPRFFNTLSSQISGTPEGGDTDQVLDIINDFTVTQRLPYGGAVSAGLVASFIEELRQATGEEEGRQRAQLRLAASLPLLRGAGMAAREDLIQAERNLVYATRGFERFRRDFLVVVATRFYDLVLQEAELNNRRRQVENFEWLLSRTNALAEAGRVPFFEVARAQQQVLFARNNLLNARERYNAALDTFKLVIGMPVDEPLIIGHAEVMIDEPHVERERAIAAALDYRLDLQTAGDLVDDARRRVEVARNNILPDLDVFADVRINTDAERERPGLDFELGDSTYAAGGRLGVPLDRRIEQIGYRRATIDFERAHRSYTLERDRVTLEVRQSIRQMEQARFTLELQNRNIEIAVQRLRGVVLRLRNLGPRDFVEAQDDLLEARNRRDAALRDLRVSILRFLLDTGQLRVAGDGQWLPPGRLTLIPVPAPDGDHDDMIGDEPIAEPVVGP